MEHSTQVSKVCLFGISGDPPTGTEGHQGIVKLLVNLNMFDEIWVLPVFVHPFSSKRSKLAPFTHRLEMSRLAFEKLATEHCLVLVQDYERNALKNENEGVTTADLFDFLGSNYPDKEFSYCLGADTYLDLARGKWCCRENDIATFLSGRFVVIERSFHPEAREVLKEQNKLADEKNDRGASFGGVVLHLSGNDMAVSSTMARDFISLKQEHENEPSSPGGDPTDSTLVDPLVLAYAQKNRLYDGKILQGNVGARSRLIDAKVRFTSALSHLELSPTQLWLLAFLGPLLTFGLIGLRRTWPSADLRSD